MSEYDNLLKILAERYPEALASWLLGRSAAELGAVYLLKTELSAQPVRADSLYVLAMSGFDDVLHIEFETEADAEHRAEMPLRELDYFVRIYRRERRRVQQFVIVLTPTQAQIPSEFRVGSTVHLYNVVKMWEQSPEVFLQTPGLLPLAVLTKTDHPENLLRAVATQAAKIESEDERNEVLAITQVLGGLRYDLALLQRTLLEDNKMMQSVTYREILNRGVQQGMQQGARQEAERIFLRQASRRFGLLPMAMQRQIEALPLEKLELLTDAVLDLPTLEALREWLQVHGPMTSD